MPHVARTASSRKASRFNPYGPLIDALVREAALLAPIFEKPGVNHMANLPREIRMQIFKYVMPDDELTIVPRRVRGYDLEEKHKGESLDILAGIGRMGFPAMLDFYSATKAFITLTRVCKQWYKEASILLYQDYTFELHVHPTGIDFMDMPRIPHLQELASCLQNGGVNRFDSAEWPFHRVRKFKLVIWAGNPKERMEVINMTASTEKIALLLHQHKSPIEFLEVSFLAHRYEFTFDDKGTFWSDQRGATAIARNSIVHGVSNLELVTAPLKQIRGVAVACMVLPDRLEQDHTIVDYGTQLLQATRLAKAFSAEGFVDLEIPTTGFTESPDANIMFFSHAMRSHALRKFSGDSLAEFNDQLYNEVAERTGRDVSSTASDFAYWATLDASQRDEKGYFTGPVVDEDAKPALDANQAIIPSIEQDRFGNPYHFGLNANANAPPQLADGVVFGLSAARFDWDGSLSDDEEGEELDVEEEEFDVEEEE